MKDETMGELFGALAAARLEFSDIAKSKSATIKSDKGTSYSYNYADLASIIEATAAALAKHGLIFIQTPEVSTESGRTVVVIHGVIAHKSGSTYTVMPLLMPVGASTPQSIGSAITFGRRYQLSAALNLAAADDDGNEASANTDSALKARQSQPRQLAPQKAQDGDVLFEPKTTTAKKRLTPEQAAIIAHLGKEAYADEWDDNMDKLATWSSQGARTKLGDLYEIEAEKLIKALNKRIQQINAQEAQPSNGAARQAA